MNNVATVADLQQAKISETLRTIIRRRANENGGIASIARSIGINAHRYYNQLNRGNGVLAETIVLESLQGHDHPLRIVAEACGFTIQPKMRFLRKPKEPRRPIRSHANDVFHRWCDTTREMEKALEDHELDPHEKERLETYAHEALKAIYVFLERIGEGR